MLLVAAYVAGCSRIPVEVARVELREPISIEDPSKLAPIQLQRIGVRIHRGTVIGVYKYVLYKCHPFADNIFWNRGRVIGKDIEFADLFYEEMKDANFNVVGDPNEMFSGRIRDEVQPAYLIGAQVEDIKMQVCDHKSAWNGRPLLVQSGKGSLRVNWQVFSPFDKKVVYETTTEGMAETEQPAQNGELVIINEAFAMAASNLASDRGLVDLLSRDWRTNLDIRAVDDVALKIDEQKRYASPISENIDQIRFGIVTIDTGQGHGSGVFISPTLILTNHHVVESYDIVRVTLLTGRKILGEVVRKHPERDVALIQVEDSGHRAVPIRMQPLKVAESVFAIGSPLEKEFSGTVTKGIVSKFVPNKFGLEDIQADVDIQPGNSGGPLLDKNGNLVGITYAGYSDTEDRSSIGMNLFIPVYDAIDKLKIIFLKRKRRAS